MYSFDIPELSASSECRFCQYLIQMTIIRKVGLAVYNTTMQKSTLVLYLTVVMPLHVLRQRNRWGNFWSFGAAWLISKEKFFNVSWIDELKLKASYGEQGNDNIQDPDYGWDRYLIRILMMS